MSHPPIPDEKNDEFTEYETKKLISHSEANICRIARNNKFDVTIETKEFIADHGDAIQFNSILTIKLTKQHKF